MSDAADRCGEREDGTGPACIRIDGHAGLHRTLAGARWGDVLGADTVPLCGRPNPAGALFCSMEAGHSGNGHQTRDESGTLHTWYGTKPTETPGFNSVVADTVRMHAAQARLDHSRAVAALESLPTLSSNARVLRARRDRLQAEATAWAHLEGVVGGS